MSRRSQNKPGRRTFLSAAAATAGLAISHGLHASGVAHRSDERVVVGIMGVGRGLALARSFAGVPGVEVRYLSDVDSLRLTSAHESFSQSVSYEVKSTGDFRRILDDPEVDALIIAAPNHWHAPAAIMACAAGKHAYVEKPCSQNPREGELLVEAARKHRRCVQMGNQRRSSDTLSEGISLLHEGRIGRVYYSRSWYANLRGPIGVGVPADVPEHIDYELWQGPAPRLPFTSNRLHYNWHWSWHYGNGELGNNGIHSIDLSRWGLGVDYPTRVISGGGRYRFDDDQVTPDTQIVSYEFADRCQIVWEGLSCNRDGMYGDSYGVSFHGENGSLRMGAWGYTLHDDRGRELLKADGRGSDVEHAANFVAAIRANDPTLLNSEIEEGHKSTLLCHLGNIAYRTGDALTCDPDNGHIVGNAAAEELWGRTYESGWEPVSEL